jgi:hypothetical protein
MALLAVIATVPRAWLVAERVDVWGDGPTRAMWAYVWARVPSLVTQGMRLPGIVYLAGPLTFLFPNPLLACHLVSLACGIATVPLLFALVRPAFGFLPAVIAALLLALLPLHIELSATALSEVPSTFAILAAVLLALRIDRSRHPAMTRAGALLLAAWAALIRYETWFRLPLLAIHEGQRGGCARGCSPALRSRSCQRPGPSATIGPRATRCTE